MSITVTAVQSRADFRQFIRFPLQIYKNETRWAPPLWNDEKRTYNPKHNPVLRESDFILLLAHCDGAISGRILVYVNHLYNAHYGTRTGMFGALECIDNPMVATALMQAAETWLTGEACDEIIGPLHPVDEVWGTLIEGFSDPAIFLTPWNHPYHSLLIEGAGYHKFKDLIAYELDDRNGQFKLPERYSNFHDRFLKRHPEYQLRPVDTKNLQRDAEHIWRISNISIIHNWGFLPASHDVLADNFKRLKPLIDRDAIWFVEYHGRPVGFCLGYADLNQIIRQIKGNLFPFGWFHILTGIKKIRNFRLFGLALDPRHHGRGLDALLYVHLAKAMAPRHIRLEANWILEENTVMNTALVRLGMTPCKRYRIYHKVLPVKQL